MAQFFERVSLTAGATVATTLDRYGIDHSDWPEIRQLPPNAHILSGTGLGAGRSQLTFLCVPIGPFMMVVNYGIAKDTVNGLRPTNSQWTAAERAAHVKGCAHGVNVILERDGNPCVGLRWVQTVKKRNATRFHGLLSPPEFVDTGGAGFPFHHAYIDIDSPDELVFDDTPCGQAPGTPGKDPDFDATVSLVVWTPPRVTLVEGYTYRFHISPSGAVWTVKPREATDAEFTEQIRILKAGVGQQHQDSGKSLVYRKPPSRGSINQ